MRARNHSDEEHRGNRDAKALRRIDEVKRPFDAANAEGARIEEARLGAARRFQEREEARNRSDKGGVFQGNDDDRRPDDRNGADQGEDRGPRSGPPSVQRGMSEDAEIEILGLFMEGLRELNPQVEMRQHDIAEMLRSGDGFTSLDVWRYLMNPARNDSGYT
jgi:hypothetical protein